MPAVHFKKILYYENYDALHFHTGSLIINILSPLVGGRASQNRVLVYAFNNVDNSG